MKITREKGYIVVDSGKPGPIYAAPHAGIAFVKPGDYQDHNTHHISWKLVKDGGKAVIALMTRERDLGLDLYREKPPKAHALKHNDFFECNSIEHIRKYRKRYSWVAKNDKDHKEKEMIYENFWDEIRNNKVQPVVFVHRQFLNPNRHPTIVDVIPFNHTDKVKEAINKLNKKYEKTFKTLFPIYKESFKFKSQCIMFKERLEKIGQPDAFHGDKPHVRKRMEHFQKRTIKYPYLLITCMNNFRGQCIKKKISKTLNLEPPIVQIESSEFLNRRFPNVTVNIIKDLLNEIKN